MSRYRNRPRNSPVQLLNLPGPPKIVFWEHQADCKKQRICDFPPNCRHAPWPKATMGISNNQFFLANSLFYGYIANDSDFHLFPQMTRNHIILVQDDDVESMLKGMRNSLPTPLTGRTMLTMMMMLAMRRRISRMRARRRMVMMMVDAMQASSCTNVQPAEFSLNDGIHSCAMCISSSLSLTNFMMTMTSTTMKEHQSMMTTITIHDDNDSYPC